MREADGLILASPVYYGGIAGAMKAFLDRFFFAGPALYNIALAFQDQSLFDIGKPGRWVGLDNFRTVLADPSTSAALWNTAVPLTLVTVVLRLAFGLALALLLNAEVFRRWRLGWLVRSLILVPWVTPPVVAVAAWKWLLDARYGVVNQFLTWIGAIDQGIPFLAKTSTVWPAIQTMLIWRELPFVVITFLAALQSIPTDLRDAVNTELAKFKNTPQWKKIIATYGFSTADATQSFQKTTAQLCSE